MLSKVQVREVTPQAALKFLRGSRIIKIELKGKCLPLLKHQCVEIISSVVMLHFHGLAEVC